MSKEKFAALMPIIVTDLIAYLSKEKNIEEMAAAKMLYSSKVFSMLENEETKFWHYSTPMLYSMLCQEIETGSFEIPDV